MKKIKTRSLLTAILAMLCAVTVALGINGFVVPENQKSASAATDLYDNGELSKTALNGLASAAGYSSSEAMEADIVDNGKNLKSSNFGSYVVTFGGKSWYPVYATAVEGEAVLTLLYTSSIGLYAISDGTTSTSKLTKDGVNISSNNYATSWIHAAINAGVTSATGKTGENTYIGGYSSSTYKEISTSEGSNGKTAPTNFTTFADFVGNGKYAGFIVPESTTGDNLWLPSTAELKSSGTWGCTNAIRSSGLSSKSSYIWSRTPATDSVNMYGVQDSGSTKTGQVKVTHNIKPAINLNLSGATIKAPTDVEKEFKGTPYSRNDIVGEWYDSGLMDVEWPTNMTDAGERKIKVTLNAQDSGIKFKGEPGEGENDYTRYFTFTITKKKVSIGWDEDKYVSDSAYFMLPTLKVTPEVKALLKYNGEVKYYTGYDTVNNQPTGSAVDLKDIDEGENYYAVVEIDTTITKDNYEISGSLYSPFDTTDGRTIVYVLPEKTEATYDEGKQLPTDVKITDKNGVELTDISYTLTYEDSEGNETSIPTTAGTYTVVVTLQATSNETYKIGEKEFTYVINKAEPNALYKPYTDKLYKGGALPEIEANIIGGGTPGTFTPEHGYKLASGTGTYPYTFTPEDTENYKTVTVQVELKTEAAILDRIEATFETTETVYTSWTETDIKKYLTVTAYYTNGDEITLTSGDYSIKGSLSAGDNQTLIVELNSDKGKTCEVVINGVEKSVLDKISSVVVSDTVYSSYTVEDLTGMLIVKGKYNDGRSDEPLQGFTITVDSDYLDENGMLKAGTGIAVTVIYIDSDNDNNELPYDLTIDVIAVKLENLSIEFDAGPYPITSTTDTAILLKCLTVTGEYNDGTVEELELAVSDITTKVNGTTLTITVTRDGKSASYDVPIPEEENVKTFTLSVPKLEATFSGEEIDILKDWQFANLIASGDVEVSGNKETNAGPHNLTITIKNTKYKWPEITPAKLAVKYTLADEEAEAGYTIEGATLTATWKIAKAVLSGEWNSKGELTLKSPSYKGDLSKLINYAYFKDGEEVDPTKLISGETYLVTAELADTSNFEFDGDTEQLLSEPHEFTKKADTPGGIKAIWNTMNNKLWVLPLWAWIAIGLALLILLIIIIVVACKRKKDKEQRDEQCKVQQAQAQTERELAVARQQAELERIRSSVGMASIATPVQQAPVQQAMPVQPQPVQQAMQQPVQQQMQPVVQQMPQSQPVMQQSAPAQVGGMGMTEMMAMMFAQFAGMKADNADKEIAALKSEKEITALKTEIEIMKLRLEQMKESKAVGDLRELTPEFLGAAIASALRGNGTLPQPAVAELPAPEPETATASAVYPPDAVITTTTTVDTTKSRRSDEVEKEEKPVRAERRVSREKSESSEIEDLDGFYDNYSE